MSVEALTWAFGEAPNVRTCCVPVLLGLANHAHANGKGAFPSQKRLAHYSRKSVRSVQNCLKHLESDKLIKRGNQAYVAWLPADRRPVVWDLAMERKAELPADLDPNAEAVSGKATVVPEAASKEAEERSSSQPQEAAPKRPSGLLAARQAARNAKGPRERRGAALPPEKGQKQCPKHLGQPAHNCGPCKGEQMGVSA